MKHNNFWVARDNDGELFLYNKKPVKDLDLDCWVCACVGEDEDFDGEPIVMGYCKLSRSFFPELYFNDDPIEVLLVPENSIEVKRRDDFKLRIGETDDDGDILVSHFINDVMIDRTYNSRVFGESDFGVYHLIKVDEIVIDYREPTLVCDDDDFSEIKVAEKEFVELDLPF